MAGNEEIEDLEDEQIVQGMGIEPTPGGLGHWIAEQYAGDDRFESVEVLEPGTLEEEAVRVRFNCDDLSHFLVAVMPDDAFVRVGLATDSDSLVERIEEAVAEIGGALTDLLAGGLEAQDDIEHEVEHFHDDVDYFCSDIPYQREEDLQSEILRDEIVYYLDGYVSAFFDLIFEVDED